MRRPKLTCIRTRGCRRSRPRSTRGSGPWAGRSSSSRRTRDARHGRPGPASTRPPRPLSRARTPSLCSLQAHTHAFISAPDSRSPPPFFSRIYISPGPALIDANFRMYKITRDLVIYERARKRFRAMTRRRRRKIIIYAPGSRANGFRLLRHLLSALLYLLKANFDCVGGGLALRNCAAAGRMCVCAIFVAQFGLSESFAVAERALNEVYCNYLRDVRLLAANF